MTASFRIPSHIRGASLGSRLRALAHLIQDADVKGQYLATFNRLVWDFFHPERPAESFKQFKGDKGPKRPISERLRNIAKYGIDQATHVPAFIKGLILFPDVIAPLAEMFIRIPINSMPLRQTREILLDAALDYKELESQKVIADIKMAGLANVLKGMEDVTLAFSFLAHNADPAEARRDLALVAEKLDVGPAFEAEIQAAKAMYDRDLEPAVYEEYLRLLIAKQQMERFFMNALRPEDGPMAHEGH